MSLMPSLKTVRIQTQILVATMCIKPNLAKHLNWWMFSWNRRFHYNSEHRLDLVSKMPRGKTGKMFQGLSPSLLLFVARYRIPCIKFSRMVNKQQLCSCIIMCRTFFAIASLFWRKLCLSDLEEAEYLQENISGLKVTLKKKHHQSSTILFFTF